MVRVTSLFKVAALLALEVKASRQMHICAHTKSDHKWDIIYWLDFYANLRM